ncbi:PREDICTED: uncharacterized protein LOC105556622 [Vollenhovia emeryi]|uniref:uncharacterized protein LOC105556622 n=1 Tax=Vollenhovia emeryi TaxID=411798 RepID=UPI0005F38904|nr:PREDICTED: uncharacterized protein LOC105556622 [Vollenhovia emeryi]
MGSSHCKVEATTECRRKDNNLQTTSKVCEIFECWPLLKHPKGYDLIEIDYASLKLITIELSVKNWFVFYANLQKICPIRKDDNNAESLNQLLQLENLTDDSRIFLQLRILPHMIPPKGRIRGSKNQWKPSISECKDSIIVHAVVSADTINIQERRREVMKKLGLTLQPFIIVVGPTLSEISSFYVCVDKVLYKVPSVLKALEICFKCFHVLNAVYPPESEHLWLLLQRSLFMFSTKWDKMAPYIMEIITELSNLDKDNNEQRKE